MRDLRGEMRVYDFSAIKTLKKGDAVCLATPESGQIAYQNVLIQSFTPEAVTVLNTEGKSFPLLFRMYDKTWVMGPSNCEATNRLKEFFHEEAIYRVSDVLYKFPPANPELVARVAAELYEESESILDGEKIEDIVKTFDPDIEPPYGLEA